MFGVRGFNLVSYSLVHAMHAVCVWGCMIARMSLHVVGWQMENVPSLNNGFARTARMQQALGNTQQTWGRRVRYHCNEVAGAVPVDMNKATDAATVFAARHFFKYASGVCGTYPPGLAVVGKVK